MSISLFFIEVFPEAVLFIVNNRYMLSMENNVFILLDVSSIVRIHKYKLSNAFITLLYFSFTESLNLG